MCQADDQHWSYEDKMQMNKDAGITVFNEDGTPYRGKDTPWKTVEQGASTYVESPPVTSRCLRC
jgi:hypothetical protein